MAKKNMAKKNTIVKDNLVTNVAPSGRVQILSRIPNGLMFEILGEKHYINGTNQVFIDKYNVRDFVTDGNRYAITYINQNVADYIITHYSHLIDDKRIIIGDSIKELEAEAEDGLAIKNDTERNNPSTSTEPIEPETLGVEEGA